VRVVDLDYRSATVTSHYDSYNGDTVRLTLVQYNRYATQERLRVNLHTATTTQVSLCTRQNMSTNGKLIRIWKEIVMLYSKVGQPSLRLQEQSKEKY
jgi:hypothetical protein